MPDQNQQQPQNTPNTGNMGGASHEAPNMQQPPQATMQHEQQPRGNGGGSRMVTWGIVAIVVLALIGAGAYAYMNDMIPGLSTGAMMQDDDTSEVVATVNGETITRNDVAAAKAQQQAAGGQEATDQQVVDALIANALVMQDAAAQGAVATETEIDQQIAQVRSQFDTEAEFEAALQEQGVTLNEFRAGVADQLTIQKYLTANIDTNAITVTEEEIQTAYDQIAASQDDIPTLEDVSSQIESLLLQQKQQQLINELVAELRADAEIDITL